MAAMQLCAHIYLFPHANNPPQQQQAAKVPDKDQLNVLEKIAGTAQQALRDARVKEEKAAELRGKARAIANQARQELSDFYIAEYTGGNSENIERYPQIADGKAKSRCRTSFVKRFPDLFPTDPWQA